jgi:hypothetical protein
VCICFEQYIQAEEGISTDKEGISTEAAADVVFSLVRALQVRNGMVKVSLRGCLMRFLHAVMHVRLLCYERRFKT